ncbi:hypothetical protein D1872_266900 [compost metagenome]
MLKFDFIPIAMGFINAQHAAESLVFHVPGRVVPAAVPFFYRTVPIRPILLHRLVRHVNPLLAFQLT